MKSLAAFYHGDQLLFGQRESLFDVVVQAELSEFGTALQNFQTFEICVNLSERKIGNIWLCFINFLECKMGSLNQVSDGFSFAWHRNILGLWCILFVKRRQIGHGDGA